MKSLRGGGWAFCWFLVVGFLLLVFCWLVCCLSCSGFGFSCLPGHSSCFPSYKSYEAQMVLVKWALDLTLETQCLLPLVVFLLVKDCQYPRDPLQPASEKKTPAPLSSSLSSPISSLLHFFSLFISPLPCFSGLPRPGCHG